MYVACSLVDGRTVNRQENRPEFCSRRRIYTFSFTYSTMQISIRPTLWESILMHKDNKSSYERMIENQKYKTYLQRVISVNQ